MTPQALSLPLHSPTSHGSVEKQPLDRLRRGDARLGELADVVVHKQCARTGGEEPVGANHVGLADAFLDADGVDGDALHLRAQRATPKEGSFERKVSDGRFDGSLCWRRSAGAARCSRSRALTRALA